MNYEEMSDFYLSKLLAKFVAVDGLVEDNGSAVHIHQYHNGCCIGWKTFDINNPADMWPIIFENKITTEWCFDDDWRATVDNQFQAGAFNRFQSFSKNPLRAAAIVFLMMKDAEKAN